MSMSERNGTIIIVMIYSIFLNSESTKMSFTSNALQFKLFHNISVVDIYLSVSDSFLN